MIIKPTRIHWRDICSNPDWKSLEDLKKWAEEDFKKECITYGFLVEDNPKYVIMSATKGFDDEWGDNLMIPKELIIKIKKL